MLETLTADLSDPDRSFWSLFLSIAIIETITRPGIVEHSYHPRIYRYNGEATRSETASF